jgi:hypothetical protein
LTTEWVRDGRDASGEAWIDMMDPSDDWLEDSVVVEPERWIVDAGRFSD